jgi:hypothetical protein
MRRTLFTVMLMSCLFPAAGWAAPAPCSLVDQETLAALALGDAVTKVEHKTVPAKGQVPEQHVDMCTITPRVGASPSLSIMVSVSLVSPIATFAALNATLRARFGRLVDGGAAQ